LRLDIDKEKSKNNIISNKEQNVNENDEDEKLKHSYISNGSSAIEKI
jgi:hypothetical protein